MKISAFLDTNIYLHFQPIEDIDWPSVLDASTVSIVIPRVVFSQLDRVKETGSTSKLRDRARRAAHLLEKLITEENRILRDCVSILFLPNAPAIDYAGRGLDSTIEDDRLLASIIEFNEEHPHEEVILISDDAGPRVKAHHFGLIARSLPDELRLPREPDPIEKELRELRRKHEILLKAQPVLRLEYEDETNHKEYILPERLNASKVERIKDLLAREAGNWPSATRLTALSSFSKSEIERYNQEVEAYLSEYEEYLDLNWEHEDLKNRTLKFDPLLSNIGGAPAEDIDILLEFPSGIMIFDSEDADNPLEDGPELPRPPTQPRTTQEIIAEQFRQLSSLSYPQLYSPTIPRSSKRNVSSPRIEKTNSYEVTYHVDRLKQNLRQPLPPLLIAFESYDTIRSFSVPYLINAIELPNNEGGEISIIVRHE